MHEQIVRLYPPLDGAEDMSEDMPQYLLPSRR